MKKLFILLSIIYGITLSAQTSSVAVNEYLKKYNPLYNEYSDKEDWKNVEKLLLEGIALCESQPEEEKVWYPRAYSSHLHYNLACCFLGIREVRERLIDGRPLVLNEDANWNNRVKQTKKEYLETYMAKNLYR